MSGTAPARQRPASEALIDDRYAVERVLGRGGMGEVLDVLERATGQRYALKRLLPGAKARHAMLLQREFHTLSSLRHPHIVQAFDFGHADGVPYYTMELLCGSDVESLAPMPWTEIVPILRDVASALSVMHARHLVHRDVGARNVWRTPEGVVKLIDFGALTGFGASHDVAGTPPYVAPESLRTRVLDQRTDLYSIGALAYLLLTGRHAYPARSLAELESHWAEGLVPPSACIAELSRTELPPVPEAFEQLIEALLAARPDARPFSAGEVLDRLHDLLPGCAAVDQVALQGVLASKAFVGRESERAALHAMFVQAASGKGGSAALLGPLGVGRTRLLAELGVEARVAGASVVQVAGDGASAPLSAAGRATLKLLEALPRVARDAGAEIASVLGHVSEELRQALGIAPDALAHFPELQGEARARMQAALHQLWLRAAADRPLLVLLDDLQGMDDASVAVFAALARDAAVAKLWIVAGVRSPSACTLPALIQAFADDAQVLRLGPLPREACAEMLRSIFGDAEHLSRTAQQLYEKAEGNPGHLMALCEYLVHGELIRCTDGVWVLPQELSERSLPSSFAQLDQARLLRAGDDGQRLGRALSVLTGAISLELCSALSPLPAAHTFAALDELCSVGVLLQTESGYGFRSESARTAFVATLTELEAKAAHLRAGEVLLGLDEPLPVQRLAAAVHFFHGGSAQRGVEVMHHALLALLKHRPAQHPEVARLIEQGYSHVQKLGLADDERLTFLCLLAWAGYFVDRRYGLAYGDEALACAQRVCGMDLARRLARWMGRKVGLIVALICTGVVLRRRAKKSALVPDFQNALLLLTVAAASLAGMYAVCLARDKVRESARAIAPLSALGPDHAASIVVRFVAGCLASLSDRPGDARRHWDGLIARLDDPRPIRGLDAATRSYYEAASLYALGNLECWRDKNLSRTLALADRLEKQPLELYRLSAHQIRANYFAQQGAMEEAARHSARVELCALQRGMTWQVEIWGPCNTVSLATRLRDAMASKRAAAQLRQLSADTPSLRGFVDYGRASYLLLRNRPEEALPLLEAWLARRSPEDVGYANLVGLTAQAYNALGRHAEAARITGQALARLRPEDFDFPALTLRVAIEAALARAGLGQLDDAAAQLDALIARHLPNEGPLTLGALHDARANVALRAGDEPAASRHVDEMARWYRGTDCPGLIQHCDRIARRWARSCGAAAEGAPLPTMSLLANFGSRLTSPPGEEASSELLAELVRGTGASDGVLVYLRRDGSRKRLQHSREPLPERLEAFMDERMRAGLVDTTVTERSEDDELEDPNLRMLDGKLWRVALLVSERGDGEAQVGAVALSNPLVALPRDVARAVAEHLQSDAAHSTRAPTIRP